MRFLALMGQRKPNLFSRKQKIPVILTILIGRPGVLKETGEEMWIKTDTVHLGYAMVNQKQVIQNNYGYQEETSNRKSCG